MNVGQRIREAREALGMQRTVLARRVGVAPNTLWRYEAGHIEPPLAMLEKIARELRTEPAEFLREPAPLGEAPVTGGSGHQPPMRHMTPLPGDESEEGFSPTLGEDFDAPFIRIVDYNRFVGVLRAAGVGEDFIAEHEQALRRALEQAAHE